MPMQPRPIAETHGPPRPNLRCFMVSNLQKASEAPNPKHQNPKKVPKSNVQNFDSYCPDFWSLDFEIFHGVWNLELGISENGRCRFSVIFARPRSGARLRPNAGEWNETGPHLTVHPPPVWRLPAIAPVGSFPQSRSALPAP